VAVSVDKDKTLHRYQANLWVPTEEIAEWEERIQPGNVFLVESGQWRMKEYEGGKYPIPILELNRFNLRFLKRPPWEVNE